MQGALSRLREWKLDRKEDDIRGWALRDTEGHTLGTVGELIVDTDSEHITKVVLANGKQYSAHDVWLGDHVLMLEATPPTARTGAAGTQERLVPVEEPPRSTAGKVVAKATEKVEKAVTATKQAVTSTKDAVVAKAKETMPAKEPIREARIEDADLVIPLIEEELEVGTRRVDAGGKRVASQIVTEPVDRDVVLREEYIQVERRAVDQPLTAAEAEVRLRDATLEMRAKAELPVVDKTAHIIEEVVLKKNVTERQERVTDTVRHTEAEVTKLNGSASAKGVVR